jgi:hypothetical protein
MEGGRYSGYRPESTFSGGDREPRLTDGMPLLQWANAWIAEDEDGGQVVYSGFVLPKKRHEGMDKILAKANWATIKRDQGNATNAYWTTTSLTGVKGGLNLFFVALGLDTSDNMVQTTERKGYGYGFHADGRVNDRGRPTGVGKLNTVVFAAELIQAGFDEPVLLTAQKMTALSFNTVCIRNYIALDKLHGILQANAPDPASVQYPAFYLLAVDVKPGKAKKVGEGREAGTIAPPWSGLPDKADFDDEQNAKKWIGLRFIRNKKWLAILDKIEVASEDSQDGLNLLDKSVEFSTEFAKLYASKGDDWWKSESGGGENGGQAAPAKTKAVAEATEDDEEMWGAPPDRGPSKQIKTVGTKDGVGSNSARNAARAATVAKPSDDDGIPF